ncbi:hypothetical protein tloyanaT_20650 [Thalassotalea loyana]|uniref:Uncharacterized protein n=1 Tax=Thalassotalea loyana TaxID=280483 RepID=A0ABQ6HCI8_9GAMM|nr:hypothetical protein [Thalassotalea loyana]GLX85813.1 hypothetical protein tloyanaT_20650 [Thalassotalea loyana]
MDVASYKRLNELVNKFARNVHSDQDYSEIHRILDDAVAHIEQEELGEMLYCDDFQVELERSLSKAK